GGHRRAREGQHMPKSYHPRDTMTSPGQDRRLFSCLKCEPVHRDLPSFPTRRSSDLRKIIPRLCRRTNRVTSEGLAPMAMRRPSRSEEHTSELQSRFELVCRLLLAKKILAGSFMASTARLSGLIVQSRTVVAIPSGLP